MICVVVLVVVRLVKKNEAGFAFFVLLTAKSAFLCAACVYIILRSRNKNKNQEEKKANVACCVCVLYEIFGGLLVFGYRVVKFFVLSLIHTFSL